MSSVKEKQYWKNFANKVGLAGSDGEFQKDASLMDSPESRRGFLKLMGASVAFAGLSGCSSFRKPEKTIVPYVKQPEYLTHGVSTYYATAMALGEDVQGLLVESHEGRPTKVEGNPAHSMSLGKTGGFQQASILNLYDPDRLGTPLQNGRVVSMDRVKRALAGLRRRFLGKGSGLGILVEPSVSPTQNRLLAEFKRQFPAAEVYHYAPLKRESMSEGIRLASGSRLIPDYHFEKADIVVSLGSDFLSSEPGHVKYSREFALRRDPSHIKGLNRLYAFESNYSLTGGMADHRIRVSSRNLEAAFWVIANRVISQLGTTPLSAEILTQIRKGAAKAASVVSKDIVDAISDDLVSHRGRGLIIAGSQASPTLHALVYLMNRVLGNSAKTVTYHRRSNQYESLYSGSQYDSLEALVSDSQNGRLKSLVVLGGDAAYSSPGDLDVATAIGSLENTFYLGSILNATASQAKWVIPQAHYLEAWSDAEAVDGSISVVQPLISPMGDVLSEIEVLAILLGSRKQAYTLVRDTMGTLMGNSSGVSWKKWLHNGVVRGARRGSEGAVNSGRLGSAVSVQVNGFSESQGYTLNFVSDSRVYDGRFVNNAWLQEASDPVSKLTWDNALLMSPATARVLGLAAEDLVRLNNDIGMVDVAVYVLPGHADEDLTLSLGYGQKVTGRIGRGTGFDAFQIQSSKSPFSSIVSVEKTGKTYPLASTQDHWNMEGRALYRETSASDYKAHPKAIKEMVEHPPLKSLWNEKKYDSGYQWGMTIDLSKCSGCNACLLACQSENNIPVVGKKEVMRGREMHWIRMDRYFEGDENDADMVHQPVACMQCELAPCEQVCPVAATTHDSEGLNTMVYNRCIGTRYCANNCPYKVRRFNFFDWHQKSAVSEPKKREHFFDYLRTPPKAQQMQFNPDVSVRMRGIMEKCTYCVQRIQEARHDANKEERLIRDGDIKTACQQSCPSDAIVFGDILDQNSAVSKKRDEDRSYALLPELNVKPRTLYLAAIKNPHPSLVSHSKKEEAQHHG